MSLLHGQFLECTFPFPRFRHEPVLPFCSPHDRSTPVPWAHYDQNKVSGGCQRESEREHKSIFVLNVAIYLQKRLTSLFLSFWFCRSLFARDKRAESDLFNSHFAQWVSTCSFIENNVGYHNRLQKLNTSSFFGIFFPDKFTPKCICIFGFHKCEWKISISIILKGEVTLCVF